MIPARDLTELAREGDGGLVGTMVLTLVVSAIVAGICKLPWWFVVAMGALVCTLSILRNKIWGRLAEPIVRVDSSSLRADRDTLVQCQVTATPWATVTRVVVGLVSVECYGENSNTESYGQWALLPQSRRVDAAPLTLEREVRVPEPKPPQWSANNVRWYLTLRVEAENSLTVYRRYPMHMVSSPVRAEPPVRSAPPRQALLAPVADESLRHGDWRDRVWTGEAYLSGRAARVTLAPRRSGSPHANGTKPMGVVPRAPVRAHQTRPRAGVASHPCANPSACTCAVPSRPTMRPPIRG
jgi:hypothetical protein